jgi:hypothetical protein
VAIARARDCRQGRGLKPAEFDVKYIFGLDPALRNALTLLSEAMNDPP